MPKIKSEEHAVAAKVPRNQSGTIEMNAIGGRVKVHLRASLDPRSRALTSPSVLAAGDPKSPARHVPCGQGPSENLDRTRLAGPPDNPRKEASEWVVAVRSTFLFRRSYRRDDGREILPLMARSANSATAEGDVSASAPRLSLGAATCAQRHHHVMESERCLRG